MSETTTVTTTPSSGLVSSSSSVEPDPANPTNPANNSSLVVVASPSLPRPTTNADTINVTCPASPSQSSSSPTVLSRLQKINRKAQTLQCLVERVWSELNQTPTREDSGAGIGSGSEMDGGVAGTQSKLLIEGVPFAKIDCKESPGGVTSSFVGVELRAPKTKEELAERDNNVEMLILWGHLLSNYTKELADPIYEIIKSSVRSSFPKPEYLKAMTKHYNQKSKKSKRESFQTPTAAGVNPRTVTRTGRLEEEVDDIFAEIESTFGLCSTLPFPAANSPYTQGEKNPKLRFYYGLALMQQAKILLWRKIYEKSYDLYKRAVDEFFCCVELELYFKPAYNKIAKGIEQMAFLRATSTDVFYSTEMFLIHFSNSVMRVIDNEALASSISLRPLIALALSKNEQIQKAEPLGVLFHISTFAETSIGKEAAKNVAFIENIMLEDTPEIALSQLPEAVRELMKWSEIDESVTKRHAREIKLMFQWLLSNDSFKLSYTTTTFQITKQEEQSFDQQLFVYDNPRKHYTDFDELNQGIHGNVHLAKRKRDGMPVVIKEMKDYIVFENMIKDEIWLLKASNHPNLQNYVESFMHEGVVFAVAEYCRGGTLTEFIRAVLPTESVVAYICKEILEGLRYLHSENRFHRDLKAENVLVYFDGGIKIADLDLCDDILSDHKLIITGNRMWMSPEILLSEPWGCKADIWSLGCICLNMANGTPPNFHYTRLRQMFLAAARTVPTLEQPNKWSELFRSFLDKCFTVDQYLRPSAVELLQHPFLGKVCTEQVMVKTADVAFWFSNGD